MKTNNFFLGLFAICLLSSACESNYETVPTVASDKTDFEIACEKSGGTPTGNNKCTCLQVTCDEGVVCNLLTKACPTVTIPESCTTGQSFCSNGKYYVCEDHKWAETLDTTIQSQCKSNGCLPDNLACAECTQNACVNGELITCKNGLIDKKTPCKTNTCEDDTKCKDVCSEGEKICKEGQLFKCSDNDLIKEKDCPAGCDTKTNNTCASNCDDGANSCSEGKLKTCKNGIFDENTSQACPNEASCKNEKECGNCKNQDIQCKDGQKSTCQNGVWSEATACDNESSCKDEKTCGECKNGDTQCKDGQIKTCTNGVWSEATSCDNGVSCKDEKTCGECMNDDIKCKDDDENGGTIQTCVNGQWNKGTPCKDNADHPVSCKDDKTCGECKNGEIVCKNQRFESVGFVSDDIGFTSQCTHGVIPTDGEPCIGSFGNRNSCNSEHTACGECLNKVDVCIPVGTTTNMYHCIDGKRGDFTGTVCMNGCNEARQCAD